VHDRCHTVKSQVSSSIGSHVCNDRKIDKYMKNLQFLLSVEHDCRTACYLPTALQQQVQQCQETAQSTTVQEWQNRCLWGERTSAPHAKQFVQIEV
jgi:hypothetical protein